MYFEDRSDDKLGKVRDPIAKAAKYMRTRSPKEKLVMLCIGGLVVRPFLKSAQLVPKGMITSNINAWQLTPHKLFSAFSG